MLSLALSACGPDPTLIRVFGVEWEETPLRGQDGSVIETVYQLEADEFRAVRTCGSRRVELSTPVTHTYIFRVLEQTMGTTSADGLSCRSTYGMDDVTALELDADGENLYPAGDRSFPIAPYSEVNGIFGGRNFTEDDGDIVNWFFTPQWLLSKGECANGISSTVVVPIEIEHTFVVDGTVRASDGDCSLEFIDGTYRYYPEVAGELLLERLTGSRILLTQVPDSSE